MYCVEGGGIFEKLQVSADLVYFYEVKSKKSANFAEHAYIKEQSPSRKFDIKSCLIFLKIPKNGQNGFLSVQRENNLGFSTVYAFKQAEEHILFQVQPLQM